MQGFIVTVLLISTVAAQLAPACDFTRCRIEDNCRCSSSTPPLSLSEIPQLITITFDEAISDKTFSEIWQPMLFNRKNPDGKPISATFYVPHEFTDYTRVRDLYLRNFEIAVNSISRTVGVKYWREASQQTLNDEFGGQRTILTHFANIPKSDIIGARTPLLQIDGDLTINAYENAGLVYDNSWPTRTNDALFPYTLDYATQQKCEDDKVCPKQVHKGFWILPITNIHAYNTNPDIPQQCNSLTNCNIPDDSTVSADQMAQWLTSEVNRIRQTSKAPLTLMLPTGWFRFSPNSQAGFTKFLDNLSRMLDVFLVNHRQVLDYIKNPVTLKKFATASPTRTASCEPATCKYKVGDSERYVRVCVECPIIYPWVGNPLGLPNNTSV